MEVLSEGPEGLEGLEAMTALKITDVGAEITEAAELADRIHILLAAAGRWLM